MLELSRGKGSGVAVQSDFIPKFIFKLLEGLWDGNERSIPTPPQK